MSATSSLTGHLLIAMPGLRDPNFEHGVAFVCQHGEDGAMGLLINRLSDYRLGALLQQMQLPCDDLAAAEQPVLSGGPVQPERGFVLHPAEGHWSSSYRINDRLALTTSRDILEAMAAGRGPRRALVALGYAGWEAGQLEQELRDNAWLTVEADEPLLFDTALGQRWSTAAARVGVDTARLAHYAGHA